MPHILFIYSLFPSLSLLPSFQLQCVAKIYDIYEKDVTKYVEEFYPQILANSDNGGVHFSFISDRDAAGKRTFSVCCKKTLFPLAHSGLRDCLLIFLTCTKCEFSVLFHIFFIVSSLWNMKLNFLNNIREKFNCATPFSSSPLFFFCFEIIIAFQRKQISLWYFFIAREWMEKV